MPPTHPTKHQTHQIKASSTDPSNPLPTSTEPQESSPSSSINPKEVSATTPLTDPPEESTQPKPPPKNPRSEANDAQYDLIHTNILPYLDWNNEHPDPVYPYTPTYIFVAIPSTTTHAPSIPALPTSKWVPGFYYAEDGSKGRGAACEVMTKREFERFSKWVIDEGKKKRKDERVSRLKPGIFWLEGEQGEAGERVAGLMSDIL